MAKKGLGRGLDALLADNSIDEKDTNGVKMLKISDVEPNRDQARKAFDETALFELADSIKMHGVIQPIAVRLKPNGYYEIIAGERRWRASKIAGLSEMPAVVIEADDQKAAELSLIENLQREDLNPAEEARGYRDLMERFELTQEEAAEKVGKSRTAVANILRILKLPESVLKLVEDGSLSYGHARTLLPLCRDNDEAEILKQAETVISNGLSVRQTEHLVRLLLDGKSKHIGETDLVSRTYYKKLENDISSTIGRKAFIRRGSDGKGRLSLAFSGSDDLERLIKELCGKDFFENEQ